MPHVSLPPAAATEILIRRSCPRLVANSAASAESCSQVRLALWNTRLLTVMTTSRQKHYAPSLLDYQTPVRSGHLPLAFLRGCGLSDRLIEYLPSLLGDSIQYYSVFISYSGTDQLLADRVHSDLQNAGVRCWFAPHDIEGGKKIHDQISEAIRIYDRLLLILSEASMSSRWVKTEIANALDKEQRTGRRVLFPVSLVPFDRVREWKQFNADIGLDVAREIREYYIPDFTGWDANHSGYRVAFDKLLKGQKADEKPTGASEE